jgi:hypothetical protein
VAGGQNAGTGELAEEAVARQTRFRPLNNTVT